MSASNERVFTAYAPAKINLGLRVVRRRADGYHDLETVFYPLGWVDTLEVRASSSLSLKLTCSDPSLASDASNLVMQAAQCLAASQDLPPGASMHLKKWLPIGAGIGGGSSDAATALHLLSRLWKLDVSPRALQQMALSIGSDVPFFLDASPAYATGRGEQLVRLTGYALPYTVVVVVPWLKVSTRWAFSQVEPSDDRHTDLRAAVLSNDMDRWRHEVSNDFEEPIFKAYPELAERKQDLLRVGACYASLTGTGSAVYGLFETDDEAKGAAELAVSAGCRRVYIESPPDPEEFDQDWSGDN